MILESDVLGVSGADRPIRVNQAASGNVSLCRSRIETWPHELQVV